MDIQSDKYILGQSTSKIISNQDDEIRLDLSLQPNTTQLLLGPQYDSFTIASLGYIPPIITNATQGTLNGVTIASNGQFVQEFGTSYASELNLIIYTMVAGQYNLNIKYLSGDRNTTLLINVAGTPTGVTYSFPKTTDWEVSSARVFNVVISLNEGDNTVKFYNSPNYPGPWIGLLTFTQVFFYRTIEAENTTLAGTAKVNDGFVSGIGYGLGSITFDANSLPCTAGTYQRLLEELLEYE